MKKHIKVKAELSENKKRVTVTFLEQSHFGSEFGNQPTDDGSGGSVFHPEEHGRLVCLEDEGCAEVSGHRMWFPQDIKQLGKQVSLPSVDWPMFKKSIELYNNYDFEEV